MNPISTFVILGMMLLIVSFVSVPVANVASVASDSAHVPGVSGFFFGNLGFFIVLLFVVSFFYWMNK